MLRTKILLWVDDERLPMQYIPTVNKFETIMVAKNSKSAMMFLNRDSELITDIHLDNDLGEVVEGKDIFRSIETMLFQGKLPSLEEVCIHTSNPAAARHMMSAKDIFLSKGVKVTRTHY